MKLITATEFVRLSSAEQIRYIRNCYNRHGQAGNIIEFTGKDDMSGAILIIHELQLEQARKGLSKRPQRSLVEKTI